MHNCNIRRTVSRAKALRSKEKLAFNISLPIDSSCPWFCYLSSSHPIFCLAETQCSMCEWIQTHPKNIKESRGIPNSDLSPPKPSVTSSRVKRSNDTSVRAPQTHYSEAGLPSPLAAIVSCFSIAAKELTGVSNRTNSPLLLKRSRVPSSFRLP